MELDHKKMYFIKNPEAYAASSFAANRRHGYVGSLPFFVMDEKNGLPIKNVSHIRTPSNGFVSPHYVKVSGTNEDSVWFDEEDIQEFLEEAPYVGKTYVRRGEHECWPLNETGNSKIRVTEVVYGDYGQNNYNFHPNKIVVLSDGRELIAGVGDYSELWCLVLSGDFEKYFVEVEDVQPVVKSKPAKRFVVCSQYEGNTHFHDIMTKEDAEKLALSQKKHGASGCVISIFEATSIIKELYSIEDI